MNQEVVLVLFQVVVLVLAFSVHECAHAWVAWKLGDPTGKMLGRVTLNPLKHLDPLGSVFMPLLALVYHWPLIGWAKPTPVTPRNFKNYKRDDILVTLAGPASNLAMATVALMLLIIIKHVAGGWTGSGGDGGGAGLEYAGNSDGESSGFVSGGSVPLFRDPYQPPAVHLQPDSRFLRWMEAIFCGTFCLTGPCNSMTGWG